LKSAEDAFLIIYASGLEPKHSKIGWASPELKNIYKTSRTNAGYD